MNLTQEAWNNMTVEEREIHYNRERRCSHVYVYPGVAGDKTNDLLRESYSFDPYAHSSHMFPCKRPEKCDCQMCSQKIGIERSGRFT